MKDKIKFICKPPGPKSLSIIKRDLKVISQCVAREYDFVFKKSKGCYVYDVDNRKYLDFAAGVAVANIGHTNPVIEKALHEQIKNAIHCGFSDFYAELPVKFAETLISFLPSNLNQVFLSNSGTESIEAAYKLARWHTNKKIFIAFENAFHGRTLASLSLTKSKPVYKERFDPFLPVIHLPFPYFYRSNFETEQECTNYCLDKIEKTLKLNKNIAGVFVEPIQGEGGYITPTKGFHQGLRKLCNQYNVLFCVDEVQTGCYRTGTFLAMENFNVKPEIVCLSKAIGGGIPIGATISNKKIMDWPSGSHGNTFGGNLLACAAGIASLNFMRKNKLGENSKKVGKYILKRLNEIKENHKIIGDVRGIGLMIGIELVKDQKTKTPAIKEISQILCNAASKGLILLPAGISTIRISPPLTLTLKQAELGLNILEDSLPK